MKKLATILLTVAVATSVMCTSVFAATGKTVTFNGGHIYQAEQGKPGTIKLDLTNILLQANVKMDSKELLTYLDDDKAANEVIYTDEDGNGYSINNIVKDLNNNGGVPVYYASTLPVLITAKTPLTAFMSFWKGDDDTKVTFIPKYWSFDDYLSNEDKAKVYTTKPKGDCLFATGTAEKVNKTGKYLFVVHDNGAISNSPLSVLCVNVGGTPSVAKATGIAINETALTLITGKTYALKATIGPANANTKAVNWTSSNTKVATVDKNGNVKAIGKGTATITATTTDGSNVKKNCTVTIK
jgi:hypothetical protein